MQLSYSQLTAYEVCPRQYEFGYVKKLPRVISPGESFGTSVHNALKKWGEEEMRAVSGERSAVSDQLVLFPDVAVAQGSQLTADHLQNLWHQSFVVEGYATKTDADAARKKGEKMMQDFYDWWRGEKREVMAVEKGFRLKVKEGTGVTEGAGVNSASVPSVTSAPSMITGRFDRVERISTGLRVIDYKTSAVRTQEDADADLQLSIYALAAEQTFGVSCSELVLVFLRDTGITAVRTVRGPQALEAARSRLLTLSSGIALHEFPPLPAMGKCSRCPFRNVCDAAQV